MTVANIEVVKNKNNYDSDKQKTNSKNTQNGDKKNSKVIGLIKTDNDNDENCGEPLLSGEGNQSAGTNFFNYVDARVRKLSELSEKINRNYLHEHQKKQKEKMLLAEKMEAEILLNKQKRLDQLKKQIKDNIYFMQKGYLVEVGPTVINDQVENDNIIGSRGGRGIGKINNDDRNVIFDEKYRGKRNISSINSNDED